MGQASLTGNGLNEVQGIELNGPAGVAFDSRTGQTHIYIADTLNSRVLAWADAGSYQMGASPSLVLGQPGPTASAPMGIGSKGFNGPLGLAVDPTSGNLYVADAGNNRVVRFLSPFDNPSLVEPGSVYGQPSFSALAAGASASSMNSPRDVAFDSSGNLWVADTGNHRVLRFGAALLNNAAPVAADTVIGQKNFSGNLANAGGSVSASGFNSPTALALDAQNNLYVADYLNARVLRFQAPAGPSGGATATAVWGQANFTATGVPSQATASSIAGPGGIAVDSAGNLYVSDVGDSRLLVFPLSTTLGAAATNVVGQTDFVTSTANTGAAPLASANTLSAPVGVKADATGNLFVADSGNNRVLEFPAGSKSASRVWGQNGFSANGPNQVKATSINFPYAVAVDYSSAPFAIYVCDASNNRVLVWKDSAHFSNGDPADLVIGQPGLGTAAANIDTPGKPSMTSLSTPAGLAVNPNDGTLYVADSGNNRILRFPRPVNQSGRITPDAVIGQADFVSAASAAVTAGSLNSPIGLALGPNGDLFVADSNNNRVLEYAAGPGNGAAAMRVYGQPNMTTGIRQSQLSPQTLANPQGVTVDQASNLYVTDTASNRVLVFANTENAPAAGDVASYVIGRSSFGTTSTSGLNLPTGVAVDSSGNIYVADAGNNRVLMYPSLVFLPVAGAAPTAMVGQQNANGTGPNWDSSNGQATADALYGPVAVYMDRQDTLYVGDAGNHRLVQFLKPASVVNSATAQANSPVAPGSLASLYSNRLVAGTTTVSGATWPAQVGNRQVLVNDQLPAPIYYLGPGQVNFQVPSNTPAGSNRIAMRTADTGELVAGGPLLVANASPGIFTVSQNGAGAAAVNNQDGTANSAANPAPQGSIITLFGTGQGQVSPPVPDGTPAPLATNSNTVAVPTSDPQTCLNTQPSICVAFASALGTIKYSGLAPGSIGLWQINVQVPQGVTGNAVQVRVIIDAAPSNTVTVAVR